MEVLRVYTKDYILLAELQNASDIVGGFGISRSGTLTFRIPMIDPKATATNLAFGNFVTVESSDYPNEPWDGDIVDAKWDGDYIVITAYDVLQRLSNRRFEYVKYTDKSAGVIAAEIINGANRVMYTGLGVGNIYSGGPTYTLEYNFDKMYDRLKELATTSKLEFKTRRSDVRKPGAWSLDFVERMGRDLTTTVVLEYEQDIDGKPSYEKEWLPANYIYAFGKAPENASGKGDNRPKGFYADWASIGLNGLYQDTLEFPDVSDVNTLNRLAREEVEKRKRPRRALQITLNHRRALWGLFTDGDIIQVRLPFYDFSGVAVPIRILSRDISYDKSTMSVAAEVLDGEQAQLLNMYKATIYGSHMEAEIPVGTYSDD